MENFDFLIPTDVKFGKNRIEELPKILAPYGKKVLLTYGGGSIRKIGVYDKVKELLTDFEIYELSGIAPNPKMESVREGVKLCKEHQIDMILAIGGGSVIDCSKVIASATFVDADPVDMISNQMEVEKALPIIAIPTVAATGSETDSGAIVVNTETNEKMTYWSPLAFPVVSILDPTYTTTVSKRQTAAGCADILSHLMEQYFVPVSTYMSDLLVESVMKTIIHYARVAMDNPTDYEARGQILWASEIADNATLCNGNQLVAFSAHGIEHGISGRFDSIHGEGLAILTPNWMRYVLKKAPEIVQSRFAHFAQAVWNIEGDDEATLAQKGIEALEAFFASIEMPTSLKAIGFDENLLEDVATFAAEHEGLAYAYVPLYKEDIIEILKTSM